MKTPLKLILGALLIGGFGGTVWAAGGAGNVLTSVAGTDLVPIDSGTLASDAQISTIATFMATGLGNVTLGTGVNQIVVTGKGTGVVPTIQTGGTGADANIGISVSGKGTGAALVGGTTTTNAGLQVSNPASTVNDIIVNPQATGTIPNISAGGAGADTNLGIAIKGTGTGNVLIGGITTSLAGLQVTQTASAVNDFVLTNAATGNTPGFFAGGAGADASVGVAFGTQGTGQVAINTGNTLQQFVIKHTGSAVNNLEVTGSTSTNALIIDAAGTGANLPIEVLPKGTGSGSQVLLGGTAATSGAAVQMGTANVNGLLLTGTNTGANPTVSIFGSGADANAGINIIPSGSGIVRLGAATPATCTGSTTATCQGQQFVVSITGLSTAASAISAAMTVTDASVASSANNVFCSVQGYTGTGVPIPVIITPGTGSVSLKIQNVSTGASLNATVAVACAVMS